MELQTCIAPVSPLFPHPCCRKLAATQFPFPWAQVVMVFLVFLALLLPFVVTSFVNEMVGGPCVLAVAGACVLARDTVLCYWSSWRTPSWSPASSTRWWVSVCVSSGWGMCIRAGQGPVLLVLFLSLWSPALSTWIVLACAVHVAAVRLWVFQAHPLSAIFASLGWIDTRLLGCTPAGPAKLRSLLSFAAPAPLHTLPHTHTYIHNPQWMGVVLTFVVVLTYWSLNEVASEMEDPFGYGEGMEGLWPMTTTGPWGRGNVGSLTGTQASL